MCCVVLCLKNQLLARVPRLLDLVRSLSEAKETCVFEIFGNFLLQDKRTGVLSLSHGYRCVSDVSLASGFRDECDFSVEVRHPRHLGELARNLHNGTYARHFERIFQDSQRAIVSLLQVVVCCDKLTIGKGWHRAGKEKRRLSVR